MNLYVSLDGDGVGRRVGQARLSNDPVEVRRISQHIESGNKIFTAWAVRVGGSVVEDGGDEALVSVPAAAVKDLPELMGQYREQVGATVSVGLGTRIDDSSKALLSAKLRGKNRVVSYDQTVEREYRAAQSQPASEAQKLGDEMFASGDPSLAKAAPHVAAEKATEQTPDHSEGQEAAASAGQPAGSPGDPTSAFHALAQASDKADRAKSVQDGAQLAQLRQTVAQALESVQQQMPVLGELKSAAPEAYKAVISLTQAVVALGREVVGAEDDLKKAQQQAKLWRAPGFGPGTGIVIPGAAHPQRPAYENAFRSALAARYANGNVRALKPTVVNVADVEPNNEVHNKERFNLYRRMLRAGDKVPPIAVMKMPDGRLKSPDGSHRLHAAVAEGVSQLHAYVVPALAKSTSGAHVSIADAAEMSRWKTGHHEDGDEGEVEDLNKRISDIPAGTAGPTGTDYSHVLTPDHRSAGYALHVHEEKSIPTRPVIATVRHHGEPVGDVTALRSGGKTFEPHSELDAGHRGLGLGKAMYEALYAHLHHSANGKPVKIEGFFHSDAAARVHRSLARKHGLAYRSDRMVEGADNEIPNTPYGYTVKSEEDELLSGGVSYGEDAPKKPRSSILSKKIIMPVGTEKDGKQLVQHWDGGKSWVSMRSGQVKGKDPSGHPVSAREPGAR